MLKSNFKCLIVQFFEFTNPKAILLWIYSLLTRWWTLKHFFSQSWKRRREWMTQPKSSCCVRGCLQWCHKWHVKQISCLPWAVRKKGRKNLLSSPLRRMKLVSRDIRWRHKFQCKQALNIIKSKFRIFFLSAATCHVFASVFFQSCIKTVKKMRCVKNI